MVSREEVFRHLLRRETCSAHPDSNKPDFVTPFSLALMGASKDACKKVLFDMTPEMNHGDFGRSV